jgi:hypothetical protein
LYQERNTGFEPVLTDLVVFLQNRAVIDFTNPDEGEYSGFNHCILRREKLSFFVESCSDPFY